MSGAQIVREQRIGFGEHGQDVLTEEVYMKLLVSFLRDGSLRKLKGAPLSAWTAVGLHEAEIELGIDDLPFGVREIMEFTGWSRPMVVSALDFLVSQRYIAELPGRSHRGEKQYRIGGYMWFGEGVSPKLIRPTRGDVPPRAVRPEDVPSPAADPDGRHAQSGNGDVPPDLVGSSQGLLDHNGVKNPARPCKSFPHDDDVLHSDSEHSGKNIIHDMDAARKIFAEAGFQGPWLEDIARVPAPLERARVWASWTVLARRAPDQYPHPYGYVHKVYLTDPFAEPPPIATTVEHPTLPEVPDASVFGVGPAGQLWRETVAEAESSLRDREVTMLLETRAVDYDRVDGTVHLTVFDPSRYLLARIRELLTRIATGIAETVVELEIITETSNVPSLEEAS